MPRNGSGTFSVLNPILVGALRSSTDVNEDFDDAGDEITNTLPLDGQAAMTGQFKAAVTLTGAPGISWADDANTGFRRSNVDTMAWVAGGQDRATMDSDGKLRFSGGLDVAGTFSHTTGFGPQTLSGIDAARLTLRNSSNDTDEHELATYASGSGTGAKGSLRMVGGGANDVATMRFYVNDVLAFQWTGSLFTHNVDTLFGASGIRGDTDGFLDFPELSAAPSSPASNVARVYSRDNGSGSTRLYYKDNSGNELDLQPPLDRQVFTSSSTWTKPTQGQTTALIETWGGGGSGGHGQSNFGAGGGGGGAYSRRVIAIASLSASVAVTVASGGASRTSSNQTGAVGGNTSFGAYLAAFGGGGGEPSDGGGGSASGGGGGGGLTSAGSTGSVSVGGAGGGPLGNLGSDQWGEGSTVIRFVGANPFGGAGGDITDTSGGVGFFGGGGGGRGRDDDTATSGGASIFGGGGGGGSTDDVTQGSGGVSIAAGNGGAGATTGTAGAAPAGGGGGSTSGNSGAGARGEVRVTCW
jgi:hypothetical protein